MAGTFANDISDHCVIAVVRNAKVPKTKPNFVIKRNMKAFVEQGFHHDLHDYNWEQKELCNDVQTAWEFFIEGFSSLVDKHAPFRRYSIKSKGEITHGSLLSYPTLAHF